MNFTLQVDQLLFDFRYTIYDKDTPWFIMLVHVWGHQFDVECKHLNPNIDANKKYLAY